MLKVLKKRLRDSEWSEGRVRSGALLPVPEVPPLVRVLGAREAGEKGHAVCRWIRAGAAY